MNLSLIQHGHVEHQAADLENVLQAFRRFGKPRLSFIGAGWYCSIEMHVSSEGTTFKVASDVKHDSPLSAATQCWQRMAQTLKDLEAKP